jgi:pyridoxamine 5'-phosphate oxidase
MSHLDPRLDPAVPPLTEESVDADPIRQFRAWYEHAIAAGVVQPEAMTLATATPDGRPSARVVLLRGFDERGFVFFTNYDSRKGRELAANPWAALVFYWPKVDRQVRIEGEVAKTTPEQSDAYFRGRPRASRLGAWASEQSRVIAGRAELERRLAEVAAQHPKEDVPRPPHWGGYRVVPAVIEFWQDRANRLHDRLRYTRQADGGWRLQRLSP